MLNVIRLGGFGCFVLAFILRCILSCIAFCLSVDTAVLWFIGGLGGAIPRLFSTANAYTWATLKFCPTLQRLQFLGVGLQQRPPNIEPSELFLQWAAFIGDGCRFLAQIRRGFDQTGIVGAYFNGQQRWLFVAFGCCPTLADQQFGFCRSGGQRA